jgi:hypothetical protein
MNANRNHKASVFADLFGTPEALREVYPLLSNEPIRDNEIIEVNTLSDVLFMDQINDVSFVVKERDPQTGEAADRLVVLLEHQSTINNNMPLRLLLYIARLYEVITDSKNLYRENLVLIPRPEAFVLYNGEEPYENQTLRLSDAYRDKVAKPALELEVKVINIRAGTNDPLLSRSPTLGQYASFVEASRHFRAAEKDTGKAMKQTIRYCLDHGILVEYLKLRGSEVENMLLTDWNWDDAKEVWQEEADENRAKKDVQKLLKHGMTPEQLSNMLEMPLSDVVRYARA